MWVQNPNSENASHALLPRDCNTLWLFIKSKECVAESDDANNPPNNNNESDADELFSAIDSDDESECVGWRAGRGARPGQSVSGAVREPCFNIKITNELDLLESYLRILGYMHHM